MPSFGSLSKAQLATLDIRLQRVLLRAIKVMDFTITEGHRPVARQQALYAQGRTKPGNIVTHIDGVTIKGMHNHLPSKAVDCVPFPVDYSNRSKALARFYFMQGVIRACAEQEGVEIRQGHDWDGDGDFFDQKFDDLPHIELA